jgi:hypothetical protein
MSEEKFKLELTAPVDKNDMVIKLTVNVEDSYTLNIRHYPEFLWYAFGVLGILAVSFISLLINPELLIVCAMILATMFYSIFNERAFTCFIDKKTDRINYHRSGVLMTSFNEQKSEYTVSKIKRLEMYRYIKGGRLSWPWLGADTFQIFLLLDKGQRVALSPSNLNFSECQDITEQIRNFLGNEIPIKAVD